MAGTSSISGVISGLDTSTIIDKLMAVAQAPITRLQDSNAIYTNRLTAWQDLNTRFLATKIKADALSDPKAFQLNSLTSSDTAISGSTDDTAAVGTYFLTVKTLAKTQQIKTQGYADTTTATLGTGTITIGVGQSGKVAANYLSGTVTSVSVGSNSTLAMGSQSLVVDSVGSAANNEMSGTFAGADATAARLATVGTAGNISINGSSIAVSADQTMGDVVDAINTKTTTTGVTATITGSADNWHITLSNQSQGSDKKVTYTEDASILNGGSSNNYDIAGTDASGHIGTVQFNVGKGNILESSGGDFITLDTSATVGTKDNAFSVQGKTTITLDDKNNTLSGLATAINNADVGVKATIINDGSTTAGYHLVLTSTTSGTAGTIDLDTSSLTGGTTPTFTNLQAAQDATITLGSGDGAINVTKGSNTITDLIPGVTLNLNKADETNMIQVDISSDTDTIKQKITDFVDQYNNLTKFFTTQASFDTTNNSSGGPLFGDSRLQGMQAQVRSLVSKAVPGANSNMQLLSEIGITSSSNDQLSINSTTLTDALTNNLSDVKRLFAVTATPSNSSVSYVASTDKTQVTSSAGYAVEVTRLATKARVTAGVAQTSSLAQSETMTINGVSIDLSAGMSQAQVIAKINDRTSATGVVASGTLADGTGVGSYLTFNQKSVGSQNHITVTSSVSNGGKTPTTSSSGIGTLQATEINPFGESGTGTSTAGLDIQGTINGEAATGNGQFLVGNSGNANTDGLTLQVTASSIGSYGTIRFTKGIGSMISDYSKAMTDTSTGSVVQAQTSLQKMIEDDNTDITKIQKQLATQKETLTTQFTKMETALSMLNDQKSYLTSQIAGLPTYSSSS